MLLLLLLLLLLLMLLLPENVSKPNSAFSVLKWPFFLKRGLCFVFLALESSSLVTFLVPVLFHCEQKKSVSIKKISSLFDAEIDRFLINMCHWWVNYDGFLQAVTPNFKAKFVLSLFSIFRQPIILLGTEKALKRESSFNVMYSKFKILT